MDEYTRVKYITVLALGIREEKQGDGKKQGQTRVGRPANSGAMGFHIPLDPKSTHQHPGFVLTRLEHKWTQTLQIAKPALYRGVVPARLAAGLIAGDRCPALGKFYSAGTGWGV